MSSQPNTQKFHNVLKFCCWICERSFVKLAMWFVVFLFALKNIYTHFSMTLNISYTHNFRNHSSTCQSTQQSDVIRLFILMDTYCNCMQQLKHHYMHKAHTIEPLFTVSVVILLIQT